MCLMTFQWQPDAENRLILSANRDEFLNRPAQALHPWPDFEGVYAGKDLSLGGTWLGIHKNGRFAALTNHRDMRIKGPQSPISRGNLVLDFLTTDIGALEYLEALENNAELYAGFNLLVADQYQMGYFSNRSQQAPRLLEAGLYGLSNALLDSPWPKVEKAKQQLNSWIKITDNPQPLTDLLSSTTIAPDSLLPDTGIGLAMEKVLSCQKIITPNYGTRCSTGLIVNENFIQFDEVSWQASGEQASQVTYHIPI